METPEDFVVGASLADALLELVELSRMKLASRAGA